MPQPAIKGLFITGTDTGVGKTFIGAALASALYGKGVRVQPRKPAESGCPMLEGRLVPADGMAYHAALNGTVPLDTITRYRYAASLAPPQAAQRQQQTLTLDQLQQAVLENAGPHDFLLVEGAGGFYSPIAADGLNADLASELRLPLLLVAANRLGCINHILLTLEAAQRRNLAVCHIVLNGAGDEDLEQNNFEALAGLVNIPLLPVPLFCSDSAVTPPALIDRLVEDLIS
jgi:dethiobiotin synthetase